MRRIPRSNVLHKTRKNLGAFYHCREIDSAVGGKKSQGHFARRPLVRWNPEYLEIFDFSIEFSSRRARRGNFRLLANRRDIILSGIFLPGVSRRHRRRRYRGTVTIVDVKVTREGGRKREAEAERREARARARGTDEVRETGRDSETRLEGVEEACGKESFSYMCRCVWRRAPRGNVN